MPSRIEELIAWGRKEVPRLCKLGNQLATARAEGVEDFSDMLERAYREEVVPLTALATEILRVEKYRSNYASLTGSLYWAALVNMARKALARFDAPAGTEPPVANPKPAAEEPRT